EEQCGGAGWAERRRGIRAGITGLWEVLGRDEIPFEEMVKLDYLYVTNWSVMNDLRLMVQTLRVLAAGGGDGKRRASPRPKGRFGGSEAFPGATTPEPANGE